jgi:hypothetical protein
LNMNSSKYSMLTYFHMKIHISSQQFGLYTSEGVFYFEYLSKKFVNENPSTI